MDYALEDILDLARHQRLLDSFCEAVGVAAAIIDLDGNVLVGARWERICTDFHRVNDATKARCVESDTTVANQLLEGKEFVLYKCKNGLNDAAAPIRVEGEHIANAFLGQFLTEEPDEKAFLEQAAQCGFDRDAYIKALRHVPILSEDRLPHMLAFLTNFAEIVAAMAIDRIRQKEAGETIERQTEEIMALSTPVIQVWDGVVVAPLIGTLDSRRAEGLMESLLMRVVDTHSRVALLDITGAAAVDTQIAQHLVETIAAVRLLGCEVVLTGVSPSIAQTLVHLGIDLSDITTRASLAQGLRHAMASLKLRVVSDE